MGFNNEVSINMKIPGWYWQPYNTDKFITSITSVLSKLTNYRVKRNSKYKMVNLRIHKWTSTTNLICITGYLSTYNRVISRIYGINVREYRRGNKKKGQFKETGKIGFTRRRQTKQKHNTKYVGHH